MPVLTRRSPGPPHLRRWLNPLVRGVLVAAAAALLIQIPLMRDVESKLLDLRIAWGAGAGVHQPRSDILVIGIDAESHQRIAEPTEFWNRHLAQVITALQGAPVRAVAIDIVQTKSVHEAIVGAIQQTIERLAGEGVLTVRQDVDFNQTVPSYDAALAQALARGRVILSGLLEDPGDRWVMPTPQFVYALPGQEAQVGLINVPKDGDGFIRRMVIAHPDQHGRTRLGIDLLTASMLLTGGVPPESPASDRFMAAVPMSADGLLPINYAGPPGTFQTIPYWVAAARAEAGDRRFFRRVFAGKVVMIAQTDMLSQDRLLTPFNSFNQQHRMAGAEVHANAINTLAQGEYLRRPPVWMGAAWLVSLTVLAALLCAHLAPLPALALVIIELGLAVAAAADAYTVHGMVLNLTAPMVSVPLVLVANFVIEGRERRRVQQVFGRHVSDAVASQILEDPGAVALGGRRMAVTILFSDLKNFTALSERIPAEELVATLNEYFTAMEQVIFRHRGTVNKFIGDGIMALFGAPVPDGNHALEACLAAQEMQSTLAGMRRRKDRPPHEALHMRIGVHTAEVIVGTVGSLRRQEYTVMGDGVNLASRLEGLNKELGTGILVSEDTVALLPADLQAGTNSPGAPRPLGAHAVKGRVQPVLVYTLDPLPGGKDE